MIRQYKRVFTMYPAWSYQREIDELNRQSELGWQLIRGSCFFSRFKKNTDIRYRYQIDYSGKVEDMGRYIETFREQGWEYINSSFNGWNYFRKLWNPALPEERYEIFTDSSSLREMIGRWIKFVAVLTVILAAATIFDILRLVHAPSRPALILFLLNLSETLFLACGIALMKKSAKSRTPKWDRWILAVFLAILLSGVGFYFYSELNRHFTCICSAQDMGAIPAGPENIMEWTQFDIPYADNYYIDLSIAADSPLCFTIVDDSDAAVYTVTESSMNASDLKLHLEKGSYRVYFSDYAGGGLEVSLTIS